MIDKLYDILFLIVGYIQLIFVEISDMIDFSKRFRAHERGDEMPDSSLRGDLSKDEAGADGNTSHLLGAVEYPLPENIFGSSDRSQVAVNIRNIFWILLGGPI